MPSVAPSRAGSRLSSRIFWHRSNRPTHAAIDCVERGPRSRGIDFLQERYDCDLYTIIAALESLFGGCFACAGRTHCKRNRATDEFRIRGAQINHEIAVNLVQADHDRARERVQRDLLCGAGFQTRASRNNFATRIERETDFRPLREWRAGI